MNNIFALYPLFIRRKVEKHQNSCILYLERFPSYLSRTKYWVKVPPVSALFDRTELCSDLMAGDQIIRDFSSEKIVQKMTQTSKLSQMG